MYIIKVIVKNYCILQDMSVELNKYLNIIVGDNECGKLILFEVIYLVLIGQFNGCFLGGEFYFYFFNVVVVN